MGYIVTQPASTTSVSIADAKLHCRITDTAQDSLLTMYIQAAESFILRRRNLQLVPATFKTTLDIFPQKEIVLPVGPVQSISSFTYLNSQGDRVAYTGYCFDNISVPARITPPYLSIFPQCQNVTGSIEITWTAGFTTVPADLRAAVLLYTADRYENREMNAVTQLYQVPKAFEDIINHWGFTT